VLLGAVSVQLAAGWFFMVVVFGFSYMTQNELITRAELTELQFLIAWVWLLGILFFGWIGDKVGRINLFILGAICSLILTWPMIIWMSQGNATMLLLAIVLLQSPAVASAPALFADLFPTNVRQSGTGVTYNGGLIIAGLLPLISQHLLIATANLNSVMYFMFTLSVLSLVSSLYLKKYINKLTT
jgi:MFS family permease